MTQYKLKDTFVFPVPTSVGPNGEITAPTEWGLNCQMYAAIALRVPASGNAELDAMIREAQRRDVAAVIMGAKCEPYGDERNIAQRVVRFADALLATLREPREEAGK